MASSNLKLILEVLREDLVSHIAILFWVEVIWLAQMEVEMLEEVEMDPTETLVVFSAPVPFSKYKFYF